MDVDRLAVRLSLVGIGLALALLASVPAIDQWERNHGYPLGKGFMPSQGLAKVRCDNMSH